MARGILGSPVVLFRKDDGGAVALGDRCPHRFAPLSKGVVANDRIQCPYHGLTFDASGACVLNPHGRGIIPPAARVPSYPLVERQHVLWIWMGQPDRADPAKIVDLEMLDGPGHPLVCGHIRMSVNYLLVTDNLLDLTHAPYLHAGELAAPTKTREAKFTAGEDWVESSYLTRSVPTPKFQRPFYQADVGDHHTRMRWTAPGVLRQFLGMTEVGRAAEEGAFSTNVHLLTPETEDSTHYFWGTSRNRKADDRTLDEHVRAAVNKAFITQDEPMIAACREYMGSNDLMGLRPVVLETDAAAFRARRILEQMVARESSPAAR